MSEKTVQMCDICEMDGEEEIAVGWYFDENNDMWDVCEKHADDVKAAGLTLHLYEEVE